MESTQEMREMTDKANQIFSLVQKAGKWLILVFEAVILILAQLAAHDNRWYS